METLHSHAGCRIDFFFINKFFFGKIHRQSLFVVLIQGNITFIFLFSFFIFFKGWGGAGMACGGLRANRTPEIFVYFYMNPFFFLFATDTIATIIPKWLSNYLFSSTQGMFWNINSITLQMMQLPLCFFKFTNAFTF